MTLARRELDPQPVAMVEHQDRTLAREEPDATSDNERFALVWIDSEGARILRWRGRVVTEVLRSDVPPHIRSTAHVRHDTRIRYGGSGRGQDDAERRRNEHLRAFLRDVAARLVADDEVEILGDGTVGEKLGSLLRRRTAKLHPPPEIRTLRSMALTQRQLATRLRQRLGLLPRRRSLGAYRWSGQLPQTRSGAVTGPRRVLVKPPTRRDSGSQGE